MPLLRREVVEIVVHLVSVDFFPIMVHLDALYVWRLLNCRLQPLDVTVLFLCIVVAFPANWRLFDLAFPCGFLRLLGDNVAARLQSDVAT